MEDNDGFIPLKKNENGVFTPVEDDGFIPVTKTSDGIFVSAEEKKKSVANQSDTQPVSQTPFEQPMQPSIESGQEDKGILNKIGDAFSGAWNKVLSGQGLFGTERETLAQQKQLEQRQNAIDLAIAKRNETERLKNEAVQKSDLVRENLKQYKAESDAVEYAAQFPEYKQLQQIDASISAIGKPSNPQQQAQYNALLAEREKLLDTDVSKRDVFAESGPKLEIKNPSDFATASEYADYQNKLFNQFSRFSKEKEKFDTAKPKFEAATKLRDVLDVAQKSQTKASWIADKVKSIQKESDDYINAARELNKDRLEPLGFTKAFVDGIQQTSLANSIADIYALGNDDKLLKSLENIYIDNTVFPKETTTLGSLGELIGGQVEPLAIGVGGGAINPIAGVVGATAEYARLGAGGQLIDAYNTARQQGMTAPEALEVAKKTAVAGAVGGAAEGLAGATFGGKPAKELATMGFKQAVKEALKDNSIDAVIAGINQTVQNKNMQRLGLDVETDRGVIENMGAELLFGAGMNLAMYGGSKVKGYGTLINGIAKMPLADIQLQVDNAVKQGVLNEANAQRFVADVAKSKEAQDKLQGVDIPEANQDKAIDLQKEIDELEAKKKTASPAILPAIESKVEALTGELQIVAGVPLTMQEKAELNRLQTARDTNTEYDKDRLDVLQKRQKRYEAGQVAGGGVTAPTPETTTPQAGSVVGGEVDLGKNTIIVNMSLPFDSGVNTGLVKNSKGAVYHDRNTSKLEKLGYSKEQIDKLSQAELDEILAKNIENPNVETSAKMPLAEEQTTTQEFLNEASKEGGRFAELAKALKQFFGIDGVETEIVKGLKDFFGKKNDGDYANNKIRIDEKAKNKLQTFLHEAIHKVTVDKLSQFERGDYSKLSKQDIEAIQNLTRIFNESKVKIHEFLGGGKGDRTKGHYGFTNVHEFISEAFTNPEFQSLLKNLPTEGNNPTIFKQFLDAVAKFLGLKDASILNDIFYYTENLNNKAEEDLIRKAPTQYTETAGVSGSALKDKKADIERRRQIGEDVLAELNKQFSDIHLSGGEAIIDGTWDGDFRGKGNQTLEVDENENIVLRRGARDEQSLTKSDLQFTNREDLYSSSTTNGIGNGVPTASNSEVGEDYKYSSNLMGVFKIPYQDFLNLVKEGKIGLGNIGESEIVISPDVAQKYLYSINGKINAKYDAELATLEKQQSGKEAPTQYTEAATPKKEVVPTTKESEMAASEKVGFTEAKDLNKIYADLKTKYGDKKGSALYEVANRLVNPNENTIVEIRSNGVVVKEGDKYILKPFGNTDANMKKWTLYKGLDVTEQFAKPTKESSVDVSDNPALKDVESTAKALWGVQKENADKFVNDFANIDIPFRQKNIQAEMDSEVKKQLFPNEKSRRKYAETIYSAVVRSGNFPKILSEAYHKAKADGSNPELVQAVEQLLTPTTTGQGTQAEVTTTPQAGSVVGGEIKSNWNYEGEGDAFASNKDSRDGKSAYTIRILDRNGRGRSYNRAKQRGELDTKSPLTYEGDKESISAIDGNGNTVGVIKLQTDGGVEHIVVAPEFSRKGVASELIKQIEQKGAKVNFEKSKLISPDAAKLFNKIRSEQSLKKEPTKQPSSEETMVGKTVTFEHAGSEKSGVVQVGEMPKPKNEYKTSTEKTLMPDGEEGVIVTIEKPDGEKVVLDAMYPEDVESEVTKKIRGFKLSQTEKPKVLEVQPQVAKNVGDVISFEHAGSEHTGKIVSIDANGNYKVRDKNGVNYTVKEDGVIEQSEIDAAKSDFFNALNEYKNATDVTKLGFALDPEKQAEAMFKVHKSLVNLAKAYISKGVSDVKKFAKQVGVSAKNAQQAWDEAMGRIKYTKDTVDYDLAEITKTAIRRGIDVRKKFSDYKSKQADISKAISDFMQDAEIRSVLNTQQVKALVSKAASVTNESQLNKFIDYAEKVISDSEYVSDMDEIRNMQQKARKRNHVSFNGIVNEFTSINPENIPDHLLLDYKAAMDDLMGRVPSYKKMGEIFYEIQSANQKPDTFSNVKTYQQAQELYNAIALNKVSSIEEYRKLFQDINGFKRRVEQLFENGDITQDQRDDLIEQVGNDQKTVEDKYASEITSLKTDLINEIRAKQKSTGISQLSTEEKKLLDRFYKLDNDDLRSLSPEELYNLSSILDNVMEEGRVDTFRLSPLVQKAEASFEANELSSQINKAKPFSEQFNDIKEAVKKMGMTYSSFWENTLGLGAVNYGAFQKYVISPMEKAIAEYRRDVNAGYEAFNNAKKKYGIGEKEMDKIGMIAHYLREYGMQNHPRYKGKKDSKGNVIGTRDWFEFMISDAETKGKLGVDKVNELKKIWDGLPKINGKVSPEDVYNSFVNGDSRFLSSNELSFLKDVMKWQSENMTGRQKFSNELRGNPFEELMFHIKRVRKGETKSQASTPVEVSGKTGNVRIAAGSGKEVTSEEMGAIETNFEKLFAETIEENSRDYHLTQMLQKQNEVLNKARQSVSDDKKNYIDAMKQNLASAVNYEFEQSKVGKIGKVLKNLMQAKAAQVLIAPIRTVGEVGAALISYPARAKAFAAYKELFTKKDAVKNLMQQTNSPYLSKVDLSRQFDIGKKGIEQESTFSKLSELFAAFPERMGIEPVWMAVFDQSFKKETGVDFDRGKYINDPSYSQKFDKQIKAAGSVADATYGQISGGTTRAGQRREIRILPDMVSKSFGGIKANSTAGNIASFMTGYPFREVEQILKSGSALAEASKGEEYTKGDVAKQLAPIIGTVLSATAYNYWQALQYQLSRIALGDDEEKEKAQKDIENLFSLSGATMETASSLAATLGSRYSGLSRNGMAWLGSLYYNVEDDAKRKQVAKDFVRNITFQEPFELQRKKSGEVNKYMLKEKISLQAVNAVAPFAAFTDNAYKAVNSVGGWDYLVKKVEKGELLTEPEKSAIIATYVAVNMGNALVQLFGYGIPNTTINKMAKEILKKGKSSSSTQDKSEANPTPSSRFSPNVPPIQLPSRKNIYIDLAKNKP